MTIAKPRAKPATLADLEALPVRGGPVQSRSTSRVEREMDTEFDSHDPE